MLDWFTPAQWGTLFGLLTMGVVGITGAAVLKQVYQEREQEREP
ncbi:MAG: hypothetical protein O2826_03335 [Chloroflexi bacterium]|jgi:hypothetical protein|nr:hypothetical protein [Chloroflexota bacterium]MDA1173534.1 hypothetical protein [Chloroflexota bacterium]